MLGRTAIAEGNTNRASARARGEIGVMGYLAFGISIAVLVLFFSMVLGYKGINNAAVAIGIATILSYAFPIALNTWRGESRKIQIYSLYLSVLGNLVISITLLIGFTASVFEWYAKVPVVQEFVEKDFAFVDSGNKGVITYKQLDDVLKGQEQIHKQLLDLDMAERDINDLAKFPFMEEQVNSAKHELAKLRTTLKGTLLDEERIVRIRSVKNLMYPIGPLDPAAESNDISGHMATRVDMKNFRQTLDTEYYWWTLPLRIIHLI